MWENVNYYSKTLNIFGSGKDRGAITLNTEDINNNTFVNDDTLMIIKLMYF